MGIEKHTTSASITLKITMVTKAKYLITRARLEGEQISSDDVMRKMIRGERLEVVALAEEKEELDITEKISDSQKEIRLCIKQLQQNVSVENTSSQNEAEDGLCEDIVELGPEFESKSGDSKKQTCRLKQRIKATKKEQLAILNSKLADDMCNMQRASSDIFSKIGQLKDTVSELNHEKNIIQTDNNVLKKEKQRLSIDAVAASKKLIKMESELTALSSQNNKINSKLADLCKSKQKVEEELDTASKEKRKVESDFDHLSRDNEVLQAELRQVIEEKTKIVADNSALKKEAQRLLQDGSTAQDQISQMASELNFLSKQNNTIKSNTIKSNLTDLSKAKQKLQVEFDTGIEERRTLQLELDHLRKGHQLLQTEILKVTNQNTKLQEDIKVIYEEKVRLSEKASSAHNQISKLTLELRNVREEKTRIEEAKDEKMKNSPRTLMQQKTQPSSPVRRL
ncbi:uncharacterized protein [Ptychodera flava]|uniref:uncharacterized protein n=1 Tax=Ptychodera flava TaxID=63121 RepID=UPI00396A362F